MANFFVPSDDANDWQRLLADPDKHWRTGYSAKSLAHSWTDSKGFPSEVASIFEQSGYAELSGLEFLLGIPEYEVQLPGGSRPSQNDIFVLARGAAGLVSIAVEGKVSESFDVTVSEWNSKPTKGRETRLAYLCDTLALEQPAVMGIRYQLLHRTASAIIEAHRFNATAAVMLVHSFSQTHEWFDDFADFARLYKVNPTPNSVRRVESLNGITLFLAWAVGDADYLTR